MLIPKELIEEAKAKLGADAALIIAKDLDLQEFDEKNLKSICKFHDEKSGSFVWNPDGHYFKCFGCGKVYGIIDHFMEHDKLTYLGAVEKLFGLAKIDYRFGEKGVKTNRDYKYPHYEFNENRTELEKYWATRGISKETLDYLDVQADHWGNTVFHYYDTNDVLTTVKYRPSHPLKKGDTKNWFQKDMDYKLLLYNMNRIDPHKPLVIVEGEPDCLAVFEAGYSNVVSVPNGAENVKWIEENFEWLEQFEKIIVWSDNDKPGLSMRKEACTRLGSWRTLFVDLPPKQIVNPDGTKKTIKDANDVLLYDGKQAVINYINQAQEMPVVGVTDLSSVDDFDLETSPGLYTGITPLDDLIYKFLLGSVVLLTGLKGSGKSTFINQVFVCEALNQGQDVFIFSGELGAPVLKTWLEFTMAGREKLKLKNDFIRTIDAEAKKKMREWYKGRVWVYDQNDNSADAVLDRAITITRKYGAKIWIIDNLMTLDIGETDGNVLQKQKEFIVKLVNLAKLYGVLVVLVAHPRKLMAGAHLTSDDVAGSSNLGNMVQYIATVRRVTEREKKGEKGQNGRYKAGKEPMEHDIEIEILKNRYTGRIGMAKMFFDYNSYRFYSNVRELFKRYKWNTDDSPLPKVDPNHHNENPYEEEPEM